MTTKPDPAVFLRAAKLIESKEHKFACLALMVALDTDSATMYASPEYALLRELYKPWYHTDGDPWWVFAPWQRWSRVRALRRCAEVAANRQLGVTSLS